MSGTIPKVGEVVKLKDTNTLGTIMVKQKKSYLIQLENKKWGWWKINKIIRFGSKCEDNKFILFLNNNGMAMYAHSGFIGHEF